MMNASGADFGTAIKAIIAIYATVFGGSCFLAGVLLGWLLA